MLYEFLLENKKLILRTARQTILRRLPSPPPSDIALKHGLPALYEKLIAVLSDNAGTRIQQQNSAKSKRKVHSGETTFGANMQRFGLSISQVVHLYGALCETAMALARIKKITITPKDFGKFNLALDNAISAAVSGFSIASTEDSETRHQQQMGELAHELRNALSAAMVCFELIRTGQVPVMGKTSDAIVHAHNRMRDLITLRLAEIRLELQPVPRYEQVAVSDLFNEIFSSLSEQIRIRKIDIVQKIANTLIFMVDRQLMTAAFFNVIHNAVKYTAAGSVIAVRAKKSKKDILIEVEDHCGGLSGIKEKELRALLSNPEITGIRTGLGMNIVHKTVDLHKGQIRLENKPKIGCVFRISLPQNNDSP